MKTQSLQIYTTPGKPQVTNLHDLKHQILQDLAMPLAWVLFPERGSFHFLEKSKLQRSKAGGQDPTLLCCAGAAQRGVGGQRGSPSPGCGREKLMPRSPLSQVRVPDPAAPAALGDAAWLARIESEC